MLNLVKHGGNKINKTIILTTPATVLTHFGEKLSYGDIEQSLHLFEPEEQERILVGLKQKQFQFWNSIETVEYYRNVHWQLPGMRKHTEKTLQSLNVQDGNIVVDLGCGWGRIAEKLFLLDTNFKYIGIDFSDEMLKRARAEVVNYGDDRVKFQNHDLTIGIPLNNNYADRILANWGIVYFPQETLQATLAEVNRVLKPGALFVCAAIVSGANFALLALKSLAKYPIESLRKWGVIKRGMKFGAHVKKLFPLYTKEQLSLMIIESGQLEIIDLYPTLSGQSVTIVAQKPT